VGKGRGERGPARLKEGDVDAADSSTVLIIVNPFAKSPRRAILVACGLVAIVWLSGKQRKRSLFDP
jgi:hypothetical protein